MVNSIKHHLRTIIPVLLVITIIITSASVGLISIFKNDGSSTQAGNSVSSTPDLQPLTPEPVEKKPIKEFKSLSVAPLRDFFLEGQTENEACEQIDKIVETANTDGFDTLEIELNYKDTLYIWLKTLMILKAICWLIFQLPQNAEV